MENKITEKQKKQLIKFIQDYLKDEKKNEKKDTDTDLQYVDLAANHLNVLLVSLVSSNTEQMSADAISDYVLQINVVGDEKFEKFVEKVTSYFSFGNESSSNMAASAAAQPQQLDKDTACDEIKKLIEGGLISGKITFEASLTESIKNAKSAEEIVNILLPIQDNSIEFAALFSRILDMATCQLPEESTYSNVTEKLLGSQPQQSAAAAAQPLHEDTQLKLPDPELPPIKRALALFAALQGANKDKFKEILVNKMHEDPFYIFSIAFKDWGSAKLILRTSALINFLSEKQIATLLLEHIKAIQVEAEKSKSEVKSIIDDLLVVTDHNLSDIYLEKEAAEVINNNDLLYACLPKENQNRTEAQYKPSDDSESVEEARLRQEVGQLIFLSIDICAIFGVDKTEFEKDLKLTPKDYSDKYAKICRRVVLKNWENEEYVKLLNGYKSIMINQSAMSYYSLGKKILEYETKAGTQYKPSDDSESVEEARLHQEIEQLVFSGIDVFAIFGLDKTGFEEDLKLTSEGYLDKYFKICAGLVVKNQEHIELLDSYKLIMIDQSAMNYYSLTQKALNEYAENIAAIGRDIYAAIQIPKSKLEVLYKLNPKDYAKTIADVIDPEIAKVADGNQKGGLLCLKRILLNREANECYDAAKARYDRALESRSVPRPR